MFENSGAHVGTIPSASVSTIQMYCVSTDGCMYEKLLDVERHYTF